MLTGFGGTLCGVMLGFMEFLSLLIAQSRFFFNSGL
jgi:hypothetical protein